MKKGMPSHLLSCPVVFISTLHEDKHDIMIATAMFISEKDPLIAVSLAKGHTTSLLIEKSESFTVIVAAEGQEDLYEQLISRRNDTRDKFKALNISTIAGDPAKPLIPKGAAAWFECKTVTREEIDDYTVFIARVTDFEDLDKPPLIWHNQGLFSLRPV